MDTKIGSLDVVAVPNSDVCCPPPHGGLSALQTSTVPFNFSEATLGRHLARRLVQIGISDVFSVPGDFNLTLLDHLIAEPGLNLVGCCNELNAGYAADGYARSRGVGACVVTFTVGGLSVINAIAGAYSENLPLICIVGGPNSNDYGTNRILHHTIGLPDFSQELRCFQTVTCYQAVVNNLEDAHELIDTAISTALKESKPVYISISCNLPAIPHPTFSREPVPFSLSPKLSNLMGLEAAVDAAAEFLNKAVKPVMVAGPKMRMQYGSIGWSVGATLGYAQAATNKRVIACIGDGSFQVTAQDVSTMLRCGQNTIIFLINNGGYTIEVEIHDGPYNVIKNWNYTALIDAIHNGEGKCWTSKVFCEEELVEAIATATGAKKDCLCFIEVIVHKDDTSKELLEWGSRVSAANSRPPNPQ
ncbi:Thiamine pyrophosphate enzyme, C-terminal TPP-binding [Cynara cardunculus var. scolymus]|uniref:pyruvate decarboxylase n=1 Tax=Cynara cardunculus var. scolymus TaxID=59895 RepID=A0A118K1U3_CYNCS|nr:Thiamine pyrophosphate enzyme, C-terminal TPP-binding [Cynara cardunculus var. scolymus]